MAATPLRSTSGPTIMVSFTLLASSTPLTTYSTPVNQLTSAVIASGHHLLKAMMVFLAAPPSPLMSDTTSLTTITLRELTR